MSPIKKEYQAIVWIGDAPGFRTVVYASDAKEAFEILKKKYGQDAQVSAWNEEDANKPR